MYMYHSADPENTHIPPLGFPGGGAGEGLEDQKRKGNV